MLLSNRHRGVKQICSSRYCLTKRGAGRASANAHVLSLRGLPWKFAQEFFCGMKDLTGIRRRGPQNADLTGIFCSSRLFKYSASALHPKLNRDFEIPRDSSRRCNRLYAQARHRAGAHFYHVTRAYPWIPLRAVNACVFLKNASGSPGRHQNKVSFHAHRGWEQLLFACWHQVRRTSRRPPGMSP